MRTWVVFLFVLLGAACSTPVGPEFAAPVLPGPGGGKKIAAPETPPEDLPGVDTSKLVPRERQTWWQLVSQLYAPCPDQAVSIAQCVKEGRPCASCTPGATLLASKVRSGAAPADAEGAYAVRFGPNVKKVELRGSPTRGPATAPVTMVIWSDFECPACGRVVPLVEELLAKHTEDVRLVHKFYPLPKHHMAEGAARAAIAAQNQGKYWEMEKKLFENQHALTEADLDRYAAELALDMKRFHADVKSDKTKETIDRDKADADVAGLSGTPFILLNGREFDTAFFRPDTDLEPWITLEVELAKKTPPP